MLLDTVLEAHEELSTPDEIAASTYEELLAIKGDSVGPSSVQTRKNLAHWKLDSVNRDIEDTERYIRKLRLNIRLIHPSDNSVTALVHLDYYAAELVEQRQELKELAIRRDALEKILDDLLVTEQALDEQFYALTVDPD